jgi:putative YhbY family RNA-binding protein
MASPLTSARRSELRAQAHKLNPLVIIGDKGLTDEVVAEIDRTLKAHELIKVRAATDDRKAREAWMTQICERLQAHAVQQIGKVLVIYRENFDKPREKPVQGEGSKVKGKAGRKTPHTPDPLPASTRTSPRQSRTPSPLPESGPRRRRPRTSR